MPPRLPSATILPHPVRGPMDWPSLCAFFAARALPGIDRVSHAGVARRLTSDDGADAVTIVADMPRTGRTLRVAVTREAPVSAFLDKTLVRVFNLDADPAAIDAVLGEDPLLRPLLAARPGLRIPGAWSPFEAAVRAIIGQQVSVKAAVTLTSRLVARIGPRTPPCPQTALDRVFPAPHDVLGADLDGLGLTQRRIDSLRALASAVAADPAFFSNAGVRDRLVALPGVGPWTADYVALRGIGDRDAFLPGDLVIRKALGDGPPIPEKEAAARAEGWRPYRAHAALHLWASMAGAAA